MSSVLLFVTLLTFIPAMIFLFEKWLSGYEGDFANRGTIATSKGLRC